MRRLPWSVSVLRVDTRRLPAPKLLQRRERIPVLLQCMVRQLAHFRRSERRAELPPLCPRTSDVDFFRNLNGVVDQQQLNRAKISRAAIDDRRFCAPERVGPKLEWVKTDTGDPFPDQARVPPGDQAARFAAAPSK